MMKPLQWIDTHAHLDAEEFSADLDAVVERARQAGVARVLVPAIDLKSLDTVTGVCRRYEGYAYPMIGLHPEEVRADFRLVLAQMRDRLTVEPWVAIGEVGLDYYWSREFEHEQIEAFETQLQWSAETQLPLAIHCRKAQNELVTLLKMYARDLPGGVFHCFTGNEHEAEQLLQFDRFVLGVGGVLTFKKSHLPDVLPAVVPLDRLVIETDAPYMAPVPLRGQRCEPAFTVHILRRLSEAYGVSEQEVASRTNANVTRVFGVKV